MIKEMYKNLGIDENVYKEWQEFTNKHKKNFKSHQLLSQALLEFMKMYIILQKILKMN